MNSTVKTILGREIAMKGKLISLGKERAAQTIVDISAKIADAVETSQEAKVLAVKAESLLIQAQIELEELYVKLKEFS